MLRNRRITLKSCQTLIRCLVSLYFWIRSISDTLNIFGEDLRPKSFFRLRSDITLHYNNTYVIFHLVYWINLFYSVSLVFCLYYSLFCMFCVLKKCFERLLPFIKIELFDIFVTLDTFPTCPRFNSLFSCVISFLNRTLSQLVSFSTCYSLKIK